MYICTSDETVIPKRGIHDNTVYIHMWYGSVIMFVRQKGLISQWWTRVAYTPCANPNSSPLISNNADPRCIQCIWIDCAKYPIFRILASLRYRNKVGNLLNTPTYLFCQKIGLLQLNSSLRRMPTSENFVPYTWMSYIFYIVGFKRNVKCPDTQMTEVGVRTSSYRSSDKISEEGSVKHFNLGIVLYLAPPITPKQFNYCTHTVSASYRPYNIR